MYLDIRAVDAKGKHRSSGEAVPAAPRSWVPDIWRTFRSVALRLRFSPGLPWV